VTVGIERWFQILRLRLRSIFQRDRVDRELDDEFEFHFDRLVEQHRAAGLSATAASDAARVEMIGFQQRKEACRDTRRVRLLEDFVEDARYAVRQYARTPGFTATILLVLALSIGGNAAIFSVAHAVLAPLQIPRADRIVMVWTDAPARNWHHFPASMPDVRDWQASGVFDSLGAFVEDGFNVRLPDRTDRVAGLRATAAFFDVLSIPAARGRAFSSADRAADNGVLLSDRLWHSLFAGDAGIVGRHVIVDGTPHTVVGVYPANAPRLGKEDLYVLMPPSVEASDERGRRNVSVIGRLHNGLSLAAASQRLTEVSLDLATRYPFVDGGLSASLQPVQEAYVQDARLLLNVLFGAVACVLAVACANIASLLLARGLTRGRELAIRAALGGNRWRLTRQLLTEHVLLALCGGAVSILPAWWGMRFIASFGLEELPNASVSKLDGAALGFTFAVALATGALCGLFPAALVWMRDLNETLKGGHSVDAGRTPHRVRGIFVVGQLAVTAVLLVVGGLALRSFLQLVSDSPGYNPSNVLTMRVALSETQYDTDARQRLFFDHVAERVASVPGVQSVGVTGELPLSDDLHGTGLLFPSQPEPRGEDVPIALYTSVSPDYFHVMEIPLVAGRLFGRGDQKDSPPVAIIDEWTARKHWPGQSAIGMRFKMGRTQPWLEVVGVVGTVEEPMVVRFLKGRIGQLYLPLTQDTKPRMTFVVRAKGHAAPLAADMRAVVREVDPDQPIFAVETLDEMRAGGRGLVRLVTSVLSAFALTALLLAIIGLYGAVAYDVGERTREFGVRMSLGAQRSSILSLVFRGGGRLLAIGVCLGFLGAIAAVRAVASLLYGIQASDPLTFALVALLLVASGLLAIYLPARRATAIDPVVALRCD
jgi:predicted permease